jgi:hypothetical protein
LREERERVEVAVLVARETDPEMHVQLVDLRRTAHADATDDRSLLHAYTAPYCERAEMRERDAVARRRSNAERESVARRSSGVRDDAVRRRHDRRTTCARNVDPTVLAGELRLRAIEQKRPEDGPVYRRARSGMHP